jgi:exodeoxyribonuclease VII large subunit
MSLGQKIEFERRAMTSAAVSKVRHCAKDVSLVQGKLKEMSPLAVLRRGYAIALKMPQKLVLKSTSDVAAGNHVKITLAEGELECRVERVIKN